MVIINRRAGWLWPLTSAASQSPLIVEPTWLSCFSQLPLGRLQDGDGCELGSILTAWLSARLAGVSAASRTTWPNREDLRFETIVEMGSKPVSPPTSVNMTWSSFDTNNMLFRSHMEGLQSLHIRFWVASIFSVLGEKPEVSTAQYCTCCQPIR